MVEGEGGVGGWRGGGVCVCGGIMLFSLLRGRQSTKKLSTNHYHTHTRPHLPPHSKNGLEQVSEVFKVGSCYEIGCIDSQNPHNWAASKNSRYNRAASF